MNGYFIPIPPMTQTAQADTSQGLHKLFDNLETNTIARLIERAMLLLGEDQKPSEGNDEYQCLMRVSKILIDEIEKARAMIHDGYPIGVVATLFKMVCVNAAHELVSRGYSEAISPT